MIIRPANRLRGRLTMPGDKSISHRAAIIAAVAHGASRISNYSTSADCAATLSCLRQLGVRIERTATDIVIHGAGHDELRAPNAPLDCENSGTTMRLLAGILAGRNFSSALTGDESLRRRPMQRIIEPLEMMGAKVSSNNGQAPLTILGQKPLRPIDYKLLIASAQVKSCILLAGLSAEGKTTVTEDDVTRDHTERMLPLFGVPIDIGGVGHESLNAGHATVSGPARLNACNISIPGDISSAAYFIAAAALVPGSTLEISSVGLNPTRVRFQNQLCALGFDITIEYGREESNEPVGKVKVAGMAKPKPATGSQSPLRIEGQLIPLMIDELPLLAVMGSQFEGGIEIRNAKELRLKESDRLATTAANLRRMGAEVHESEDGLRVAGPTRLRGASIDAGGDHRIAMAFSVAGLIADGETEIKDDRCVAVSFPEFFDLLRSVVE